MRSVSVAAWAVVLLFLCPSLFASEAAKTARERVVFEPSRVSVMAERADSPEKRSRGLMNRASLGDKEAMMFYFEQPGYHAFWMYNTRIPLTVVFLDDRFTIVDIKNMSPCPERNPNLCPSYAPGNPARYAIEVNQGFVERYGVKVGDRVKVERTRRR